MAQQIKIRRGTNSELDAYGALANGEFGLITDRNLVVIGNGGGNVLVGKCVVTTELNRPLASDYEGMFHFESDTGKLRVSDGAAWNLVGATDLSQLNGTLDGIDNGTTYGKVFLSELNSGYVSRLNDGSNSVTATDIVNHIDNLDKHRTINDSSTASTDLWSADKINSEIANAIAGRQVKEPVLDIRNDPPSSPSNGDRYIIGDNPTGDWDVSAGSIAEYELNSWAYYGPQEGWTVYVKASDKDKNYTCDGTTWHESGDSNQTINANNGLTGGGVGSTIDLAVGAGDGINVLSDSIEVDDGSGLHFVSGRLEPQVDGSSLNIDGYGNIYVDVIDGGTF